MGPVDAAELRAAWTRRAIQPGTLVCAEGFAAWVPFDTVGELVGPAPASPSLVQWSPPSGTPNPVRSPMNPRLTRKVILGASATLALSVVAVALIVTVRSDAYKLATMSPAEAADLGFSLYDTMTAPEETRAIPFFEKACKAGDPRGCTGLGTANFDGNGGLSKSYERAVELLDPACAKGVLRACRKVANCYAFGWGTQKDVRHARELWERACDGGEARACHHLGNMYTAPDGPPELRDLKLGLAILRKACAGGAKEACDQARVVEKQVQQEAEEATCSRWMLSCVVGSFPDGSERRDQSMRYGTRAACEVGSSGLPFRCDPCRCLERREPPSAEVATPDSPAQQRLAEANYARCAETRGVCLAPDDLGFVDSRGGAGWGDRCFAHIKSGQLGWAEAECDEAMKLNPTSPLLRASLLYNKGLIEQRAGHNDSARGLYQQSLALRPNAAVRASLDSLDAVPGK